MPRPMYTWGRFDTSGPRAMTSDTAARMTATQMPAPTKAWPKEVSRWAYQPGSPSRGVGHLVRDGVSRPVEREHPDEGLEQPDGRPDEEATRFRRRGRGLRQRLGADDVTFLVSSDFGHTIRPRRM